MGVPLVSSAFADVLDPRFRDIALGTYNKGKSRIPDFYTVESSDRSDERYSALTPMGSFQQFVGSVPYDAGEQEYSVTATHLEYALGVMIQRKLWEDDQYGVIDEQFSALGDSAFKTHENIGADLFNSAFSATSTFYSHDEAVALCSSSHTTPVAGVSTTAGFSNYSTSALSPTALTSAVIAMRQFKDAAGDFIDETPTQLIVPVNLRDRADEIVKTSKGLDGAEGNINVHEGRFSVVDWVRLSDTNNWFLLNGLAKKNFIWFWRVKLELSKMESFDNILAKARGYMRFSYLRRDWRGIYGASVS